MSERKAINKYYPPDVDPSKVKFSAKKGNKPMSVRLMVPFSMKCTHCNEYIAKSRKFNARKEVTEQHYLGIKIIKFHIRCSRCYAELIFQTDPKNGDYECVQGCKKNYERAKEVKEKETVDEMIVRLEKEMKEDEKLKKIEKKGRNNVNSEETGVEQLEKRLTEQQKEKERVEALEELQEQMTGLERKRQEMDISVVHSVDDKKLQEEAKQAFQEYRKQQAESDLEEKRQTVVAQVVGIAGGYSDSDSDDTEDEIVAKRSMEQTTVKRKKQKIIM